MVSSRLVSWAFSGVVFISGCGGATQPHSEQRDTDSSEGGQAENGSSIGGKSFDAHTGGTSTKSSLASAVQGEGGNGGGRTSIILAGGTSAVETSVGGTSATTNAGGTSTGGTSTTTSAGGTSAGGTSAIVSAGGTSLGGTSSTTSSGGTSAAGTNATTSPTVGCLVIKNAVNNVCTAGLVTDVECSSNGGIVVPNCPSGEFLVCTLTNGTLVGPIYIYDAIVVESLRKMNPDPCKYVSFK